MATTRRNHSKKVTLSTLEVGSPRQSAQTPDALVDFGILLGLAYQSLVDALNAALVEQGFTDIGRHYGYVFRALDADALHLRQLAERLGMTDPGASKIVNEMEACGYLERYPDRVDGRVKKLRLSPRGQAALALARRFHQTYEARLAKRLSPLEVSLTRSVLQAMVGDEGANGEKTNLRVM